MKAKKARVIHQTATGVCCASIALATSAGLWPGLAGSALILLAIFTGVAIKRKVLKAA